MSSIKGHFDGTAIILDEPTTLAVGQTVQVIADRLPPGGRFADRVVLPEFSRLSHGAGDVTETISRIATHETVATLDLL